MDASASTLSVFGDLIFGRCTGYPPCLDGFEKTALLLLQGLDLTAPV
ncbi:MAG: hypothetical protein AW12_03133 [Candidatus Accumulibacter sp. BA-94]|nr:MAG: hypothetical protein AW12_03133 [Candidatus Accumulibacter sp. BA-94]